MRSTSLTLEQTRSSARVTFGFLIPFVLGTSFGAYSDVGLYVDSFKFSKTTGIVIQKELFDSSSRGKVRLNCTFYYEFDVDGHRYGGSIVTPESMRSGPFKLNPFRSVTVHDCPYYDGVPEKGGLIQVLYDPKKPVRSIIIRKFPAIIFLIAFMLVSIWISLGIYIIVLRRRAASLM